MQVGFFKLDFSVCIFTSEPGFIFSVQESELQEYYTGVFFTCLLCVG